MSSPIITADQEADATFVRTTLVDTAPWLACYPLIFNTEVFHVGDDAFGLYLYARPFGPALELAAVTVPQALVRTRNAAGVLQAVAEELAVLVGGPPLLVERGAHDTGGAMPS